MSRAANRWLFSAIGLAGCGDASAARSLPGAEIEALFADRTVRGHHEIRGYDFRSYYADDGTFRSHQAGRAAPRAARWWIARDDICIEWQDSPGALCRGITVEAGRYRKVLNAGGRTKVVVTFQSFTPGNPEAL